MFKRKIAKLLPVLTLVPCLSFAQTVHIDYSTWFGTTNCNAFGAGTIIHGVTHKSTMGQPKYINYNDPVSLECKPTDFDNFDYKSTEYAIGYNFQANHEYKITVNAASVSNMFAPTLALTFTNSITTSTACTGPAVDADPLAPGHGIYGPYYGDYEYTKTIGSQAQTYVKFRAIASSGGGSLQKVIIRRITVEDITQTQPQPVFTVTSSAGSRTCGASTLSPIYFTVNNVNNTPNVTGYDFILQPAAWYLHPALTTAPTLIHQTSNVLGLVPIACGPGSVVTVVPYVNNVAQPSVARSISVTLPSYVIGGPSSITGGSVGSYELLNGAPIMPTPPVSLPCSTVPVWSVSDNRAFLNVVDPTHATLQLITNPGTTILKATMNMCGKSVSTQRTITLFGQFGPIDGSITNINAGNGFSISPNPTNGKFNISLGEELEDELLTVYSVDGRMIHNKTISGNTYEIDLSNEPAGIYIIKINNGEEVLTGKVVKQ